MCFDDDDKLQQCSSVTKRSLGKKKDDHGSFTPLVSLG